MSEKISRFLAMAKFELQAEKSGSYLVDTFLLIQMSFGIINAYQSKKFARKLDGL